MPIDGFVPLSSYDDRRDDSGHSAAWKALREAIKSGEVEGYQRGGSNRWIVNKEQADRFLLQASRPTRERKAQVTESHDTAILAGISATLAESLSVLREILDRLPERNWPADEELPG